MVNERFAKHVCNSIKVGELIGANHNQFAIELELCQKDSYQNI